MAKSRKPAAKGKRPSARGKGRLYTLEVFLLSGPITAKFAKKNPVVSRTIQMRGDQTWKTFTTPSSTPSTALTNTCTSSSSARGRWTRKGRGT